MVCPICKSTKTQLIYKSHTGYVEDTYFDIYECNECLTQFIEASEIDQKIYEVIYSSNETPGYKRYLRYAQGILKSENPLKYLASEDSVYYPIQYYLNKNNPADILEVGCGYGYLTYALNKSGYKTTGIDISANAINFARRNFGDHFQVSEIKDLTNTQKKYDLIIATELIEHLADINLFIENCLQLLSKDGKILLTTPNRDFFNPKSVCQTDLPPVHTVSLGKKSINALASRYNLEYEFIDFNNSNSKSDNKLLQYFISKRSSTPKPVVSRDGKILRNRVDSESSMIIGLFRKVLTLYPIRSASNLISHYLLKEYPTLAIVLKRKT